MKPFLELDRDLLPLQETITAALARVEKRFNGQLESDLPPVSDLVRHIEHYRGKMLRPVLVLVSGLAAAPHRELTESHTTVAAVCEMVHMATLVHDDILDEADTRRRGRTVNRLHGNEAAVILGDYLIASAFHLCSQLDSQAAALLIGHVSMVMCAGELLQLHHREDFSLDEPTYFEIVNRKTAALIGGACRLGALQSGADEATARRFERFGIDVGVAFQIQDDILDLTGREDVVGKSVGKDLVKGKLTLPVIHHLASVGAIERGRTLELLRRIAAEEDASLVTRMARGCELTGSVRYARRIAADLVERGKDHLKPLPDGPAKSYMLKMADAVVTRAF